MKVMAFIALYALVFLSVAAGQNPPPKASAHFEISGKIVNSATGAMVHGVSLQLAPSGQRGNMQQLDSPDGNFEFRNVAPGKYTLSAQAPGFPQQLFEQHGQFNTGIAVGPEKVSTSIIFKLGPEGSISGRVLDEHNEPARDAQVMLFEKSTDTGTRQIERRNQAQTDDLGEYRFSHLRPGTYYLALSAQPWYRRYLGGISRTLAQGQPKPDIDPALDVAYPIIYYPGATDPDSAGAVVLHPGDRITADFDLTPVPSLHVTIRTGSTEGGPPIQPNLHPRVFGESFGFMQTTMTWGQGQVEISGIAAGDYQLEMMHPRGRESSVGTQEVNLQGDGEIDASSIATLEGVHGVLKFDGKDTPRNAFIQLRDAAGARTFGARLDEQGEFRIQPNHAGRYVISLANAPGYAIRTISATGANVSGRTLEFTGSQPVELAIDASQGVGTINGTVMNGDKSISGAMVVLVPPNMSDNVSLFRRDQSDSDGTFILRDVVPGTYTAIAVQNGWDMEWASPDALRPYLAKGARVEVIGKQQLDIKIVAQ